VLIVGAGEVMEIDAVANFEESCADVALIVSVPEVGAVAGAV
jgi:hypothetical protein